MLSGLGAIHLSCCNGTRGQVGCPHYRIAANGVWGMARCFYHQHTAGDVLAAAIAAGDKTAAFAAAKAILAAELPELTTTFWEGPESNCPARRWAGLAPADVVTEQSQALDAGAQDFVENNRPLIDRLDKTALVDALVDMVAMGGMAREKAERVAGLCGINLDAPV